MFQSSSLLRGWKRQHCCPTHKRPRPSMPWGYEREALESKSYRRQELQSWLAVVIAARSWMVYGLLTTYLTMPSHVRYLRIARVGAL